jgi:CelD/BcsL family acetyltransferase involved in cellulose biosynthesis
VYLFERRRKTSSNDMKSIGHSRALAEVSKLTYQVLDTLHDIAAISAEWDLLLDQSPCNRAFSCSRWFLVSCSLNQSISPHVIVARRGAAIVGVLPLVLTQDDGIATFASELSDYNDIISNESNHSVSVGLLEYALTPACKRVVLSRVRRDSNCFRAAEILEREGSIQPVFQASGTCPYVDLPFSYEEYLRTRSKSFRKGLRRAQRKAESSNIAVKELDPIHFSPSRLPEEFLSLNLDRWGAKSYYRSSFVESFVLKLLPNLFSQRRMRAFALMKEERLLGLDLCMVGANSLCSWNGGFLSEAARWSPGKLLIDAGIRQAYAWKFEEYDLMRGQEAYKKSWANNTREIGSLLIG